LWDCARSNDGKDYRHTPFRTKSVCRRAASWVVESPPVSPDFAEDGATPLTPGPTSQRSGPLRAAQISAQWPSRLRSHEEPGPGQPATRHTSRLITRATHHPCDPIGRLLASPARRRQFCVFRSLVVSCFTGTVHRRWYLPTRSPAYLGLITRRPPCGHPARTTGPSRGRHLTDPRGREPAGERAAER
jgi:hypothetical protein